MRAHPQSEILHQLIERQKAIRSVLRGAHFPSFAVAEASRMLRATAHELEVLASDCEELQAEAAARSREELKT